MNSLVRRELVANILGHSIHDDNDYREASRLLYALPVILEPDNCGNYVVQQEPKYCDRNICIQNEYNGIGCDECEVTKSQEPKTGHWVDGLIAKVLEEVDGGTDDTYIRYADICNRVEKSIREYCGAKMVEPQESEG